METKRRRLTVSGTVQGVGFRPFVYRLAHELALTGAIGNDDKGVWCEIQGRASMLDRFQSELTLHGPPLARVEDINSVGIDVRPDETTFRIAQSSTSSAIASASIPPDVAPCAQCVIEIRSPGDRRHRYAFACCTDCGPRYTVVDALPYDRERTSMASFPLCTSCAAEFAAPGDRRHHAQTTCCPKCGPTLSLTDMAGAPIEGDPLAAAASLLVNGKILALKGVGGFQLLCRADDDAVVRRLRKRKHRDEKPFAVMVGSDERAHQLVVLDEVSLRALTSAEAPIVLATRREQIDIAPSVAPDSRLLGLMMPASPLHRLLADAAGTALVCTSGNRSAEPMATNDAEAMTALRVIADAMLTHDRRIERHADDSVGRSTQGRFQLLRRARGFAPRPVRLLRPGPPVLGVGAELKSTVCLGTEQNAHVSAHLGDLENPHTLQLFERAIADLIHIVRVDPELVVHDLHPEYLSTKFASAQPLAATLAVQHHHAHLASCLADNAFAGRAIGVTFDGLGWGTDATMWGGEFLIGDATGFRRAAHLRPVPMPGHGAAIREPWRMAIAHLHSMAGDQLADLPVVSRHDDEVGAMVRLCDSEATIVTSSMGRLFDAVAAMCNLADRVSYEGQAAILLEQVAIDTEITYEWNIGTDSAAMVLDPSPLIAAVGRDVRCGVAVGEIAGAFHRSVATMIRDVCVQLRDLENVNAAALTGGVFQNQRLVELVVPLLTDAGFETLWHAQVPCNDGGISLGQVAIGRAHLADR
jgi:hydrogenase maturation protein HypF